MSGPPTTATGPSTLVGGPVAALTVVYDETCEFCRRCRSWLQDQPTRVPLHFLAAGSTEAQQRYGPAEKLRGDLMVVAQDGRAWIGSSAFVATLWATERYHRVAEQLSQPGRLPWARVAFDAVSHNRSLINALLIPKADLTSPERLACDIGPPELQR